MVALRRDVSGKEHRKMLFFSAGIGDCTFVEDSSCSPESGALSNSHCESTVTYFLNLSEKKKTEDLEQINMFCMDMEIKSFLKNLHVKKNFTHYRAKC